MWIIDMLSNLFMGNDYNFNDAQQMQQQMDQEMLNQQMQQQMDQEIAEMNDPYIHSGLDVCVDESYHGIDHGGLPDLADSHDDGFFNNDFFSNDDWGSGGGFGDGGFGGGNW